MIRTSVVDEHILIITLDRPEARNAFDGEMAQFMEKIMDDYEANDALWAAIIQAEGPTFCAGQDLKAAQRGDMGVTAKRGAFGFMRMPPNKPLIAAVDGQAFAGGMEMILSCDLIVASEISEFAVTEAKRALMAGGGGCFRLPQRIPYHIALEMIMTGDAKGAEEMHRLGLVNKLVKEGQAENGALELARRLVANSPIAVQNSRAVAVQSVREAWTDAEAWEKQIPYFNAVANSEDMKEGIAAFIEKRKPNWQGR